MGCLRRMAWVDFALREALFARYEHQHQKYSLANSRKELSVLQTRSPTMAQSTRLQVSLSAKGLKNLGGMMDRSDPFAVLTVRGQSKDDPPMITGETEVQYNNLNPQWATVITLDGFSFGTPMYIEVGIFDFDAKKIGKKEKQLALEAADKGRLVISSQSNRNLLRTGKFPHAVMGTALFEVGEVLGSRGNLLSKKIQTGGVVYVNIERSRSDGMHGKMKFQLRGLHLTNTRTLGKSSPFFELLRKVDRPTGATWSSVYRSNVVKSNLNPRWEPTRLDLELTCNGDLDRAMKVVVKDHRLGGNHKEIGEFETNMRRFIEAKEDGGDVNEESAFTLTRHERLVGRVLILEAAIYPTQTSNGENSKSPAPGGSRMALKSVPSISQPRPDFIDYLTGGCQISLAVAIDFTGSNGNPLEPGTPHFFYPPDSGQWNDYQKAIYAVGTILAKFDSDQRFPVWGFGAKYNGFMRNCFQCGSTEDVRGVRGILDAYQGVFTTPLTMSYPTDYTEVISTASMYSRHELEKAQKKGELSYTILLILTAGDLKGRQEIQKTKRELIEASGAPLSVVIVGIGENDFSSMEFLDEHDPNTEGGRDITKFVKFAEYRSFNHLTQAVLDEIPGQLVDYYVSRNIMPGHAKLVDHTEIRDLPADDDERTVHFLG